MVCGGGIGITKVREGGMRNSKVCEGGMGNGNQQGSKGRNGEWETASFVWDGELEAAKFVRKEWGMGTRV